jgi:uncharacterized membrane protein HdeD (DUF308 family)
MGMIRDRLEEQGSRLTRGLIIRGCVAIGFGVALLVWPGIGLRAFVLLFGAYSFVDGAVALYSAIVDAPTGERAWLALHGVAGILVGVAVFVWTDLTALALLYVIGTWAIIVGVIEFGAALAAPAGGGNARVLMGLHGAVSVTFGVVMWWRPGAGALALATLVATFAIVTGATRIALGIQLHRGGEAVSEALFPGSAEVRT